MSKLGMQPGKDDDPSGNETEQELLQRYLALSQADRIKEFAGTAQTANLLGLSRRTVQLWVETGVVKSISIGKKHFVSLNSLRKVLEQKNEL